MNDILRNIFSKERLFIQGQCMVKIRTKRNYGKFIVMFVFLFWLATVPVFVHIYAILDKLL